MIIFYLRVEHHAFSTSIPFETPYRAGDNAKGLKLEDTIDVK